MQVPPYIPQPVEIPNNLTQEKYLVRLGFVRRVAALHMLTLGIVAALVLAPIPQMPLPTAVLLTVGCLIALVSLRRIEKGQKYEQIISLVLFPLMLVSMALTIQGLDAIGWPMWALPVGVVLAQLYTFVSGRDLSYIVMFLLPLVLGVTGIIVYGIWASIDRGTIFGACILHGTVLFYYVYDLASLLSRRRLGEELGAVIDLYRDPLNFLSYTIRVIRHWRKYSVWGRP
ncbi:MAG: hypothetical protein KF784_13925 [Fimbriimonadaceae bacterium]|nr:hypothetical protein [Fimbriimonadaceae bacterium]